MITEQGHSLPEQDCKESQHPCQINVILLLWSPGCPPCGWGLCPLHGSEFILQRGPRNGEGGNPHHRMALLVAEGTGDKWVPSIPIPKGHTHVPHTADESAIIRALQSGQGTSTALLQDLFKSKAGKIIGKHWESKQKPPLGKAWLISAPSYLRFPFGLVLRCLCSFRETIGSLEHKWRSYLIGS